MSDTFDLPLFSQSDARVAPYRKHSATSRAASEAISPKLRTIELAVLRCLIDAPRVIDEIAAHLGKHVLVVRPRISELKEAGLVEVTKDTGRSALGHRQSVVRITEKGRAVANDAERVRANTNEKAGAL